MFAANPATKPRTTRSAALAAARKVGVNDENARPATRTVRDKAGVLKEATGVVGKSAVGAKEHGAVASKDGAAVSTKKRAALGDVSNANVSKPLAPPTAKAAVGTTTTATSAVAGVAPVRVTRSMANPVKTRKASASEVAAKAQTAASAANAIPRLAKKTQQALENVASNSSSSSGSAASQPPKKTVRDASKQHDSKDAAVVPTATRTAVNSILPSSMPEVTFKNSSTAAVAAAAATKAVANHYKKDTHVPQPVYVYEEEDSQEKLHISKRAKTTLEWDDLDAEDAQDPVMVSEYVQEIFEYMRELEIQTMPNAEYMNVQKELQWKMRSILIDWLIEVHHKFRLLAETLYLTVNIIDRFLSVRVISLVKLQLVGVTAMFIAAKYEEVVAPSIKNFLYMADGGYTDDEILRAERYLLQVLDFSLQYPSPMSFLRRTSKADHYDIQTRTLAKYLMEVSLVDHRFLKMPPSLIAAAGLYLARHMLLRGEWNGNLTHYSGYAEEEIYECAELMLDYLAKPVKYEALYKKYSARKFMKAAIFVEDWIQRQDTLILRKPVLALTGGLTPEPVETCQHEDDTAAVHGSQSHGHAEPKQKHSQQTSNSTVVETQEQFQDANEEQCDDGRDEGHDGADEQDADTYRDGNDETSDSSI